MATPAISDDQRDALAAAIAAALLLIWIGRARQALDRLGLIDTEVTITPAIKQQIATFARDRAQKVQTGTNARIAAALAALSSDATETERADTIRQQLQQSLGHNRDILIPFFASWAAHQALLAVYRSKDLADKTQWVWTQQTPFTDECADAAGASPASLNDLFAITGGPPPVHERCQCILEPA